jgi:hypothetical protein
VSTKGLGCVFRPDAECSKSPERFARPHEVELSWYHPLCAIWPLADPCEVLERVSWAVCGRIWRLCAFEEAIIYWFWRGTSVRKVCIKSDYLFQSLALISESTSKVSTKGLECVFWPDAEWLDSWGPVFKPFRPWHIDSDKTQACADVSIQSYHLFQSLVLISEDAPTVSTKGLVSVFWPKAEWLDSWGPRSKPCRVWRRSHDWFLRQKIERFFWRDFSGEEFREQHYCPTTLFPLLGCGVDSFSPN